MIFKLLFFCLLACYINCLNAQTGCKNLTSEYESKKISLIKSQKILSEFIKTYDFKPNLNDYDSLNARDKSLKYFNKEGLITEINMYFLNAIKTNKYSYNQNNKLVEIEIQSPKGVLFEKTQFLYSDLNNLIKALHFIEGGVNDKLITFIQNSEECIENHKDLDGTLKNYEKWIVNKEKGIEEHLYLNTKDQIYKREYIEYNSSGNPVKRIFENKNFGQINISEYDYNANGQVVVELTKDRLGTLKKQQKYIYNEKGLLVETQLMSGEGNPISKDIYSYEFYK